MENYAKRFDSTKAPYRSYWARYIAKKITTKGTQENNDCSSYCEEFKLCDFFVVDSSSYYSTATCYFGTFQHLEKVGSAGSVSNKAKMYLVYKSSKFKNF